MTYVATTGRLLALLAALLLPGCGDTRIAFCSGGDEFCGRFFDDTSGDEQPPEDPEPNPPSSALARATTMALQTPKVIGEAIASQQMGQLIDQDPHRVALWMTAATLAHEHRADGLLTTKYLDQTRAWLPDALARVTHSALQPAARLFEHFAEHRDPSLAEIARTFVAKPTSGSAAPTGDSYQSQEAYAHAVGILSTAGKHGCCSNRQLAAAAVVLCAARPRSALGDLAGAACQAAALSLDSL